MFRDNYSSKDLFPYATGYYMVLPRGLEGRDVGGGSLVIEEDYLIYFKEGTPEDIKNRFIKDYARHHAEEEKEREFVFRE